MSEAATKDRKGQDRVPWSLPEFFPFGIRDLLFLGAVVGAFIAWDITVLELAPRLIKRFYKTQASDFWMLVAVESVLYGSILSQTTILGIWSSLADGSTFLRILLTTLIVTLFCTFVATNWGSDWFMLTPAGKISYTAGKLFILALLLSVQIPLYALRFARGWRITNKEATVGHLLNKPQNSIAAIFGYVAFAAFLILLGEVSYQGTKWSGLISLFGLAPVCSFCGVRFLAMLSDKPILVPALAMLATFPVVGCVVAIGYHFATGRSAWDLQVFESILIAQVVAVGTGFVTLFAARRFGLRFVTNRDVLQRG